MCVKWKRERRFGDRWETNKRCGNTEDRNCRFISETHTHTHTHTHKHTHAHTRLLHFHTFQVDSTKKRWELKDLICFQQLMIRMMSVSNKSTNKLLLFNERRLKGGETGERGGNEGGGGGERGGKGWSLKRCGYLFTYLCFFLSLLLKESDQGSDRTAADRDLSVCVCVCVCVWDSPFHPILRSRTSYKRLAHIFEHNGH